MTFAPVQFRRLSAAKDQCTSDSNRHVLPAASATTPAVMCWPEHVAEGLRRRVQGEILDTDAAVICWPEHIAEALRQRVK